MMQDLIQNDESGTCYGGRLKEMGQLLVEMREKGIQPPHNRLSVVIDKIKDSSYKFEEPLFLTALADIQKRFAGLQSDNWSQLCRELDEISNSLKALMDFIDDYNGLPVPDEYE